ncbi:hypothetical protein PROFUN_04862 [Planoprotostelium fungivorum]|uniref:Uncharacterized protein n=1 Tax=Planoprotostelium fungivorum TaxID=1890364 RepID=A0A2P6NF26_9EUKA|nr:hypothetical protein PROFUN_04862 [Planoprotostelium fungivorum]
MWGRTTSRIRTSALITRLPQRAYSSAETRVHRIPPQFRKPSSQEINRSRFNRTLFFLIFAAAVAVAPWKSWRDHIFYPEEEDDEDDKEEKK